MDDQNTAKAFANSWNSLPQGSVYTVDQVRDWLEPIEFSALHGIRVLELGCGNGSLLVHIAEQSPAEIVGVDLGDSVISARANLDNAPCRCTIIQGDLTQFEPEAPFDLAICIGVLQHLKSPKAGFDAVIRSVAPGGRFHCWVYAQEGNALVRAIVEPLRWLTSKLPWWITKYGFAFPLSLAVFPVARALSLFNENGALDWLPLGKYLAWLGKRDFNFTRHVIFDQLVTPETKYFSKSELVDWMSSDARIDQSSTYLIFRNGNSWKFGGQVR